MIINLLLPMSTASKQQLSDVPLTMTLWPSAFLLKDFVMWTPLHLTLSMLHTTIVSLSHWVKKVPLQELFSAQSLV